MFKSNIQNKVNTSAEYLRRIDMAFEFIDSHIEQTIQLKDVAAASHFSSYHFHRIFHSLVGETVNEYVFRKRIERAVKNLLGKPELSITEIAAAGGYSSSANFSKAFKSYFGVTPSELRKNDGKIINSKKGKLYRKYGKAFNPHELYSHCFKQASVIDYSKVEYSQLDNRHLEKIQMQVRIEQRQEKRIAYLTSPKGYVLDSVYATWDKVHHWAKSVGISITPQVRFAICHDNPVITPEDKCRYDAAIVIGSEIKVDSPFKQSVMPAGNYAIAYYKDDAEKISDFMNKLYSRWFPDSGYEPDNYPSVFNYLNDSREDDFVEMDVYIKIKELEVV
jgi:AraC family transcriptional regulator